MHRKGNREDNLRQYSPNCKSCISVNTAKRLAEQYKAGERTIHNDARFASAVDTLEEALGTPVKHQILRRDTKLTKNDVLSIVFAARNSGKEVAKTRLSNKVNKTDIVKQIKNKQRVPNPHYKGQVCQIIACGDKELKKFAGCWGIIIQVNEHSCNIQTWREDIPTVKPENLKPLDGVDETLAAKNFERIRKLADKVYLEYDPMHVGAVEALAFLPDPSQLTPKQKRMLAFLEKEYNLESVE